MEYLELLEWKLKKTLWLMKKVIGQKKIEKLVSEILLENDKDMPVVFILESMYHEDISSQVLEGKMLATQLDNMGVFSYYYYIHSRFEFKEVISLIKNSVQKNIFLHVSFHADEKGFAIGGNNLSQKDFIKLISSIKNKDLRIFISSCSIVEEKFATDIINIGKVKSVLGPNFKICYHDAHIFWATLYHQYLRNSDAFGNKKFRMTIEKCVDLIRRRKKSKKNRSIIFARKINNEFLYDELSLDMVVDS